MPFSNTQAAGGQGGGGGGAVWVPFQKDGDVFRTFWKEPVVGTRKILFWGWGFKFFSTS